MSQDLEQGLAQAHANSFFSAFKTRLEMPFNEALSSSSRTALCSPLHNICEFPTSCLLARPYYRFFDFSKKQERGADAVLRD